MEFQFECECGEQVTDFTRGDDVEISTNTVCDSCGTMYALTITAIRTRHE